MDPPTLDTRVDGRLVLAAACSALLLLGLPLADYGNVTSDGLWQNVAFLVVYAAAFALVFGGALHVIEKTWETPRLPYVEGALLTPTALIEFRGAYLRVYPLARLHSFQLDDIYGEERTFSHSDGRYRYYRVKKVYRSTRLTVSFGDRSLSFLVYRDFLDYLAELEGCLRERAALPAAMRPIAMRDVDPFFEARVHPSWPSVLSSGAAPIVPSAADGEPMCRVPRLPSWVPRPPPHVIVAVALVPAAALWIGRNYGSDVAGYRSLARAGADAHRNYLRHGWLYTDEVRQALPYLEALEGEPRERALQAFLRLHPRHARAAEARAALHERFTSAARRYEAEGAPADPAVRAFMQRALSFQERSTSPPAVMRFSTPDASTVASFDAEAAAVARVREAPATALAPRFAEAEMRARESAASARVGRSFESMFGGGILPLVDGGRRPAANEPPAVRLDVSYTIVPSGAPLADFGNARAMHGVDFEFRVAASVPDGGPPLRFETRVVPSGENLESWGGTQPLSDRLAAAACDRAFVLFAERLAQVFFRAGSSALGPTARDDSPARVGAPYVARRWTAAIVQPPWAEAATARLSLSVDGPTVTGSYRGARGGPQVADGTLTGTLVGRTLTATCADEDGASGPCTFVLSIDGQLLRGMVTSAAGRSYWTATRR